jgi:murein DD-endopeptidase MepM/ murein hydrolase activator NlpD
VSRAFERPSSDWGAGHRGIDIVAGVGALVRAPVTGVVTFVGTVAGRGVIVIGTRYDEDVTLEPIEPTVAQGDAVAPGDVVGLLRSGHDGGTSLHFGVRVHGEYVDPAPLLPAQPRIVVYDSRLVSW